MEGEGSGAAPTQALPPPKPNPGEWAPRAAGCPAPHEVKDPSPHAPRSSGARWPWAATPGGAGGRGTVREGALKTPNEKKKRKQWQEPFLPGPRPVLPSALGSGRPQAARDSTVHGHAGHHPWPGVRLLPRLWPMSRAASATESSREDAGQVGFGRACPSTEVWRCPGPRCPHRHPPPASHPACWSRMPAWREGLGEEGQGPCSRCPAALRLPRPEPTRSCRGRKHSKHRTQNRKHLRKPHSRSTGALRPQGPRPEPTGHLFPRTGPSGGSTGPGRGLHLLPSSPCGETATPAWTRARLLALGSQGHRWRLGVRSVVSPKWASEARGTVTAGSGQAPGSPPWPSPICPRDDKRG